MAETAKVIHLAALHFGRLVEVVQARRELSANIPAGTKLEMILHPSYWKHYVRDIQPMDIIEAFCEDGTWEASLRVMFVGTAEVKLAVRWQQSYELTDEEPESDVLFVKWISPPKKFGVIRKDDKTVIKDGLYPKAAAYNYLRQHLANMKT